MLSIATPVRGVFGVLLATLIAAVLPVCSSPAASAEEQETLMRRLNNPQLGDLPALRNRRAIIVLVTDRHGNVAAMNPAAAELLGWKRGEARGIPLADVAQRVEGLRALVQACADSGATRKGISASLPDPMRAAPDGRETRPAASRTRVVR